MNERMLRNASAHFVKALARENETHGGDGEQDRERSAEGGFEKELKVESRMTHGTAKVAQTFLDEVGLPASRCSLSSTY